MDSWEKLQKLMGSPREVEGEIVKLLQGCDEPTREDMLDEVRYSLGGDVVERILCRLQEVEA